MNLEEECSRGGTDEEPLLTRRRLVAGIAATIGTCLGINIAGLTDGSSADEQPLYHTEPDSSDQTETSSDETETSSEQAL